VHTSIVITSEHGETTAVRTVAPVVSEPVEPKKKSRLRGLFSPLLKSHKNNANVTNINVAGEEADSPFQNGSQEEGDEKEDEEKETEENDHTEPLGESPPRVQTPYAEMSRPGGALAPRCDSPLLRPRERGDRDKLALSDSPEFSAVQRPNPEVPTEALLVRRRSESDTTIPSPVEKEDKSHVRHRSNTFLSKIGAMSFRKSNIVRNSSEIALSATFVPPPVSDVAVATAGDDSKTIVASPEKPDLTEAHVDKNGAKHNDKHEKHDKHDKHDKHEKHDKRDKHEKQKHKKHDKHEKTEKFDPSVRARVDVRIDDAIDV
jgi:hypothetical protein